MADLTKDVSVSLYQYLCQNIVGSENHVNTNRLMHTVRDNLSSVGTTVNITGGSFGEGLDMRGSDMDKMYVLKCVNIFDNIASALANPSKKYLLANVKPEYVTPGFAMLCLISKHSKVQKLCGQIRGKYYLSNFPLKHFFLNNVSSIIHGPCVTDRFGLHDLARCLHSQYWAKPAAQWITRSNNSWPNHKTKQMIIKHGVLFAPVGIRGSPHEELEWRISFSVGEKLLIYTFSHTQLLCYALMKILLKDVINKDMRYKDILCSYFLKTIIFWISEEIEPEVWTPDNLITCFMRCFRRLIYCVEFSVCPHYFIPENNLFENKMAGKERYLLLYNLNMLLQYGWRCILFSDQISNAECFSTNFQNHQSIWYYKDVNTFLMSKIFLADSAFLNCIFFNNYSRAVYQLCSYRSKTIQCNHKYCISLICSQICQTIDLRDYQWNKMIYKRHKTFLTYALMNLYRDAVSGWLMLASYFYKTKQYYKSLILIEYVLSKCTLDTLFPGTELSVRQRELVNLTAIKKQGVIRMLHLIMIDKVKFILNSTIIPLELAIEHGKDVYICYDMPPTVYAHFLSFLCHYQLNNVLARQTSLLKLKLTMAVGHFDAREHISYYCLGTALQMIGEENEARLAFFNFKNRARCLPDCLYTAYIRSFTRLSKLSFM